MVQRDFSQFHEPNPRTISFLNLDQTQKMNTWPDRDMYCSLDKFEWQCALNLQSKKYSALIFHHMHRPGAIFTRCGSNAGQEAGDILAHLLEICQSIFSHSKYLHK